MEVVGTERHHRVTESDRSGAAKWQVRRPGSDPAEAANHPITGQARRGQELGIPAPRQGRSEATAEIALAEHHGKVRSIGAGRTESVT